MPSISHLQLPSGNTYEIKDEYARQLLAGGLQFIICWDGTSTPDVTKIPAGVVVTYQGTDYTGTKSAETAEALAFYLVKVKNNVYSEYVAIGETGSKTWELLGDTSIDLSDLGALAYKDNVTLSKGSGDQVLGESTSFTNGSSEVTFASGAGSDFVTGYNNDGVAPSFTEGVFNAGSLPSLGASSKSQFAVEGIVAAMGTGNDAETLIFSAASKSNAVTEQGAFSAGSLPSKAADTFNAGSAATLAKAKALTAANTGTAAAQTITVGTNDKVKVAKYDDLGVSVS